MRDDPPPPRSPAFLGRAVAPPLRRGDRRAARRRAGGALLAAPRPPGDLAAAPAGTPPYPPAPRRSETRCDGLGAQTLLARGAADQHRHRLVDRRGLLVGGERPDRDRPQLPAGSGGADPHVDPRARPRWRNYPQERGA